MRRRDLWDGNSAQDAINPACPIRRICGSAEKQTRNGIDIVRPDSVAMYTNTQLLRGTCTQNIHVEHKTAALPFEHDGLDHVIWRIVNMSPGQ
jgi:hypothetical protein